MICKNCGAEVPENTDFCEKCGAIIDTDVPTKDKKEKKTGRESKRRSGSGGGNGLLAALLVVASLALIGVVFVILALYGVIKLPFIDSMAPSGDKTEATAAPAGLQDGITKAPKVEPDPDDDTRYFVLIYAREGRTLVYESSVGIRQEVTVPPSGQVRFHIPLSSLMPNEPVEEEVYYAVPKIYIRNGDGPETLVEGIEAIPLRIPALEVGFDNPDALTTDDGRVVISGRISQIGAELTIGGEPAVIAADGTFSQALLFTEEGEHTVEAVAKLAGYRVFRHSFTVTVNRAPAEALIQLPWEYGDTSFNQRIKNDIETIEVRGRVPSGSTVTVTCESESASLTAPTVAQDGTFSFEATLAVPGDYLLLITCVTPSGSTSTREMHVQRAPDWRAYVESSWAMSYEAFAYQSNQAYKISGTVTEIIEDGDYILAVLELSDGRTIELQYHNHYAGAGSLAVGTVHTGIYGRPMGIGGDGMPLIYVWFVID